MIAISFFHYLLSKIFIIEKIFLNVSTYRIKLQHLLCHASLTKIFDQAFGAGTNYYVEFLIENAKFG